MKAILILPGALLALSLNACQTSSNHDPDRLPTAAESTTNLPLQNYSIASTTDLDGLLKLMRRRQPALVAASSEIDALRASSTVAGALPDPSVQVSSGRMAETAAGRVNGTLSVEQRIPNPKKRRLSAERALSLSRAAEAKRDAIELQLSLQLRNAYWTYYQAYEHQAILRQSRSLLEQVGGSIESRIAASSASQADLLRLNNQIAEIDANLARLQAQVSSSQSQINGLLHREPSAPLPKPKLSGVAPSARSLSIAASSHPEIRAAMERSSAASQSLRLAKLARSPDYQAGLSYGNVSSDGLAPSANGRDQVMASIGMTIPLWETKNRALEAEARATLQAAEATTDSLRSSLRSEAAAATADITAQQQVIELFETRILPDAQQAFDLSTTAYASEKASFNDLIDAWRQQLSYQQQQASNRAMLGKATARFKQATGQK